VELILFLLIFLIALSWIFIQYYFDNSHEVFSISAVKNLHLVEEVKNLEKTSQTFVKTTMSTMDFEQAKKDITYLILKPKQISGQFDWSDIWRQTKQEYRMIYTLVLSKSSFIPPLLWTT